MPEVSTRPGGLQPLFFPRAVAFVGVSPDPMKYSGRALRFLRDHGFPGSVYAVNPKYQEVLGAPCVPSARDLPEGEIDLAFIAVSAERVAGVVAECGRKGIGAAIVASSGFREAGAGGAEREAELRRVAREAGVRLCGPNCIGVANTGARVVVSFGTVFEQPVLRGNVTVLSQSGAFSSNLVDALRRRGLGIRYMVSSGNEADITMGEYLDFAVDDADTQVVLVYMEGMRDADVFLGAARKALAASKPVVLLKTGRSAASRRAILSHTGSLAGDDAVEAAAFARFGVIVVPSIDDMLETAMVAARQPQAFAAGSRVGVVCIGSGGATSLAADLLEREKLELPELSEAAASKLSAVVPSFVTPQNPLDVAGTSFEDEAAIAGGALETFAHEDRFDTLIAVVPGLPHVRTCVAAVKNVAAVSPKAVVTVFCGGPYTDMGLEEARKASLAWSDDLERVARALGAASRFAVRRAAPLPQVPRRRRAISGRATTVPEFEAKRRLGRYGLSVSSERLCTTVDDALRAAQSIGYPVALKAQSTALPHKSDVGGVALGLDSEAALREAFAGMERRIEHVAPREALAGYLVQEMIADGIEVFVGVKNDPTYGPTLLLGPGGMLVEVIRDVGVSLLPASRHDVDALLAGTVLSQLLAGVRGRPAANREALIRAVDAVARFALDHADTLLEVEVNPFIVRHDRAVAVDALIVECIPEGQAASNH